jgi:hypothetical protein
MSAVGGVALEGGVLGEQPADGEQGGTHGEPPEGEG